jgi:sec-independent protein translocase protein TatA
MFGLGTMEMVIIGLVVVLLFGGSKLPQLGAGLGESIRNFKKAMSGSDDKPSIPPPGNDQPPKP